MIKLIVELSYSSEKSDKSDGAKKYPDDQA